MILSIIQWLPASPTTMITITKLHSKLIPLLRSCILDQTLRLVNPCLVVLLAPPTAIFVPVPIPPHLDRSPSALYPTVPRSSLTNNLLYHPPPPIFPLSILQPTTPALQPSISVLLVPFPLDIQLATLALLTASPAHLPLEVTAI